MTFARSGFDPNTNSFGCTVDSLFLVLGLLESPGAFLLDSGSLLIS